ncbi:MAG: hypothetical protein WBC59_01090 [Phycisphaerae bacterium]
MMKTKLLICLAVGFLLGFGVRHLWPNRSDTAGHWRTVREYKAYITDPSNYTPDPQTGFSVTEPPNDPMPSLAALVAAGELNHVDLVLPTVPYSNRDATRHWMQFCQNHDDIVDAYGNPSYVAFPIEGAQPLHLNIWFKDSAESAIQQLIKELEQMGPREEPTTP